MKRLFAAIALGFLGLTLAVAAQPRSTKARVEFARSHPCPVTGEPRLPCPGYVIDHVTPLCAGGADHPRNMQWQEHAESLRKDRAEIALCAWIRKGAR